MSALRHLARRCASSLNAARGLATKTSRKGSGKTAAKAAASASPSSDDDSGSPDHSEAAAGTAEDGTIGAEADKAARAAKEAAESFTRWAKGAGAKLGDGAAKAAGGAKSFSETADKRSGGLMTTIVNAFKEEYRLAMMDLGDAAMERRKSGARVRGARTRGPVRGDHGGGTRAEEEVAFRAAWETVSEKTGLGAHVTSVFSKLEGLKQHPRVQEGRGDAGGGARAMGDERQPDGAQDPGHHEGAFSPRRKQAEAYRCSSRHVPDFNMNGFIAECSEGRRRCPARTLKGDVEALERCAVSKEMLERMGGQMKLWQHEGQFVDPRMLHLSEMELVEVRILDNAPMIVLQFSCQQINCVRNKDGEIVEGAEDDIQSVHYLWAMQLEDVEYTHSDGRKHTAPTWQLREMVLRGMMAVAA